MTHVGLLYQIIRGRWKALIPIGSMYGIFTYIWLIFMVNVGEIYHTWILWDIHLNKVAGLKFCVF